LIYSLTRRLLFNLEPEEAHELALRTIARAGAVVPLRAALTSLFAAKAEPVTAFGLTFANRVGLAAGYDKNGDAWPGLATLGFGHIEVGTVTPEPQPGNPRPRVFRLVRQRSVINRMGFPGRGAAYVAEQLRRSRPDGLVLGVNIGKQKTTSLEDAAENYEELIDVFAPLADYLAVNISSPNTPGLRRLQERDFLEALLNRLVRRRQELSERLGHPVPLLVKVAPDLTEEQLDTALGSMIDAGIDGVIATNTTISRDGVDPDMAGEEGGLSGALLTARSTEMVRAISQRTSGKLPIIGVGGIMGPDDAQAKLDAGATLVQVYTGLVYAGPELVKKIIRSCTTVTGSIAGLMQ
jgi:dihydroorotate dehydrogenase